MSVIELLWHLNVTDGTKYLIIFGMIVCILVMCVMNGEKNNKYKKKNKLKRYNEREDREEREEREDMGWIKGRKNGGYVNYPTQCQSNYTKCVENNIMFGNNEFCYPCLNDGNSPDFFYNPQINQWVKLTNN